MNINSYIPINTNEKVDAIIEDILQRRPSVSIELDILKKIKKFKTQLYFKDRFSKIKHLLRIEDVSHLPQIKPGKCFIKKESGKEINTLLMLLFDIPVIEISKLIGIPSKTILKIVKQNNINCPDLDEQSFLSYQNIRSCEEFFVSTYEAKQQKEKKNKELENPSGRKGLNEKFKPSLGKEGNYRKLILYGPKT